MEPRGRERHRWQTERSNGREHMSQSVGSERVSTDLAGGHGDHEDDSGVKDSTQGGPVPL